MFVGDNLEWLHNLAGRGLDDIALCYLDPPYNTGSDFDHYNDNIDSVSWFENLRDRLEALRPLMRPTGSVWLQLDDREQHNGRRALESVFGVDAFVATIIWQKRTTRDSRRAFSSAHEYIHVFSPAGAKAWRRVRNGDVNNVVLRNPDNDPRGPWRSVPLTAQAGNSVASQHYEVLSPSGDLLAPPRGRCWTYTEEKFAELVRQGRVYWPRAGAGRPRLKMYGDQVADLAPSTLWLAEEVGDTTEAKRSLLDLPSASPIFDTPKPVRLMERIIRIATNPGDVVLDPYFGSGTTALVSNLHGVDCIGIEQSDRTVSEVTLPRLRASGIEPAVERREVRRLAV